MVTESFHCLFPAPVDQGENVSMEWRLIKTETSETLYHEKFYQNIIHLITGPESKNRLNLFSQES